MGLAKLIALFMGLILVGISFLGLIFFNKINNQIKNT